ncbi:MAG: family 43 glycosylhydrolase [Bacteroidales bacterium]|nr:family 43 glycosylhydrolase [Bacteroidales bacterium]
MRKVTSMIAAALVAWGCGAQERFANPVIGRDWPDPTVWEADGTFYTVATGMRTILTSPDLVHWTDSGKAPLSEDARAKARAAGRNFWAPDVVRLGDRWMLYLTCYNSDRDCGIFAFSAEAPDGPFEFIGKITHSTDTGIKDTIDPEVLQDPATGQVWLFFGSVGSQHRVRLNPEGTAVAEGAVYEHTAGLKIDDNPSRTQVYEGAYLYRRDGWWYLFVSGGNYGDGSYKIRVGRSRTLEGDFTDREGRLMKDGYATLLLSSDPEDTFYGPGHNGEIFTDLRGQDYMLFHCHNRASGTRSRFTFLQRLFWDAEGWPYFEGGKVLAEDLAPLFGR